MGNAVKNVLCKFIMKTIGCDRLFSFAIMIGVMVAMLLIALSQIYLNL